MRVVFFILLVAEVGLTTAWGAACCGGASPRNFIQLQRLQTYEVGISSSVKDLFGRYDAGGNLVGAAPNQTVQAQLGAGLRLARNWDASFITPLVLRQSKMGGEYFSSSGVGDIVLGVHFWLLESLFQRDLYPTIRLQGGLKIPSGPTEAVVEGKLRPAIGNGAWEPSLGVVLEKHIGVFNLLASAYYISPIPTANRKRGDLIEATARVSFAPVRRWNLILGVSESILFEELRDGKPIAGTNGHSLGVYVGSTYFVSRFLSAGFGVETSVLGRNYSADQAMSLVLKYGFY